MSDAELASLEVDFSGITFITGGSKFSALNTEEVISKIGCKAVLQHSGTTEFCGLTTMELAETAKPGSAGLLVANVSLKVGNFQVPNEAKPSTNRLSSRHFFTQDCRPTDWKIIGRQ